MQLVIWIQHLGRSAGSHPDLILDGFEDTLDDSRAAIVSLNPCHLVRHVAPLVRWPGNAKRLSRAEKASL